MDELGEEALVLVRQRLAAVLANERGKLRASDALSLAGYSRPSYRRKQLVARVLREMGWTRARYRFDGNLLYAYGRGTQLEREVTLDVERGDDGQLIVKRREP